MKRFGCLLLGVALGCCSSGCASTLARTAPAVPLEIPNPPPRASIEPVPLAEPAQPERPAPRPVVPEPAARQNRPSPAGPPPAVNSPAPPAPVPSAPATELRAGEPAGNAAATAQVREVLTRTHQMLDGIDRAKLSTGRQTDYDTARRFAAQAEAAIKANNLLLARYSAQKAEALANGLR